MDGNLKIIINGPDPSLPIEGGSFFTVIEKGSPTRFFIDEIEEKKPSEKNSPEIDEVNISGRGFFEKDGGRKMVSFLITFYSPQTRHGYLEEK